MHAIGSLHYIRKLNTVVQVPTVTEFHDGDASTEQQHLKDMLRLRSSLSPKAFFVKLSMELFPLFTCHFVYNSLKFITSSSK